METLKRIINWIKSFFIKTKIKLKKQELIMNYTNKQLRDSWLQSTGYTVPRKIKSHSKRQNIMSEYVQQVKSFIKAKKEKGFYVYDIRNKYGIPFYEIRILK